MRQKENAKRSMRAMWFQRAAFLLVILAVCVCLPVHAEKTGDCEKAFVKCLYDPVTEVAAFYGKLYCIAGYVFCLKYIKG